ncbi:MAG: hypothetical protein AAF196_06560 [Planctomycetota bacterium]
MNPNDPVSSEDLDDDMALPAPEAVEHAPRSLQAELRAVLFLYGTVAALAYVLRSLGS